MLVEKLLVTLIFFIHVHSLVFVCLFYFVLIPCFCQLRQYLKETLLTTLDVSAAGPWVVLNTHLLTWSTKGFLPFHLAPYV